MKIGRVIVVILSSMIFLEVTVHGVCGVSKVVRPTRISKGLHENRGNEE